MNHLWRWKAFTIPGPLSSYGIGGPSWGSLFTKPGSYKPGMAFDSSLGMLLGMLSVTQINQMTISSLVE